MEKREGASKKYQAEENHGCGNDDINDRKDEAYLLLPLSISL